MANLCPQQAQDSKKVRKLRKKMEQIKCWNTKTRGLYEKGKRKDIQSQRNRRWDSTRNWRFSEKYDGREIGNNKRRYEWNSLWMGASPRPIITKFSFYRDKEYAMTKVENLKGTGIGISHDYPKEIDVIHEKLYPVLKKAKQGKQSAFFKVDKLIINGQV